MDQARATVANKIAPNWTLLSSTTCPTLCRILLMAQGHQHCAQHPLVTVYSLAMCTALLFRES